MPSLGPAEILVVLVIALLIFGPDKMPDIARQVGRGFREFRRVQNHLKAELRDVVSEFDSSEGSAPTVAPPAPTAVPTEVPADPSTDVWARENTGTPVPTATGDPLPSLPPLEQSTPAAPAAQSAPPAEVALPPAEVALPPAEVALPPAEVALPPAQPPAENA